MRESRDCAHVSVTNGLVEFSFFCGRYASRNGMSDEGSGTRDIVRGPAIEREFRGVRCIY